MFYAHTAEISIARDEPGSGFDAEEAARQVARRFCVLAEKIVANDLLKAPKIEASKKTEEKIRRDIEFDQRLKTVKLFIIEWNKWRDFYYGLEPMMPKTRGQVTQIENAIEFMNKHGFEQSVMIAVIHKAYEKRRFKPNFGAIVSYGGDLYDDLYERVISDVDRANYEKRSLDRV